MTPKQIKTWFKLIFGSNQTIIKESKPKNYGFRYKFYKFNDRFKDFK